MLALVVKAVLLGSFVGFIFNIFFISTGRGGLVFFTALMSVLMFFFLEKSNALGSGILRTVSLFGYIGATARCPTG